MSIWENDPEYGWLYKDYERRYFHVECIEMNEDVIL